MIANGAAGPFALIPSGATASVSCSQKVDQTFAGVQFGKDFSVLNVGGWNFHAGATAGYLEAKASMAGGLFSFTDPVTGQLAGGGSFDTTTQVPFIGIYAAATNGGFSVDALLRTEYYQMNMTAPGANLSGQNIDAHGWSFSSSMAYQWQVPNSNWFIEPSAGIIITRTKVDPLNLTSSGSTLLSGCLGTPFGCDTRTPLSIQFNEIKSDIGRLGLRFGTTIDAGNVIWQPFAAVSVWHEFGPNITANATSCANCVGLLVGPPLTTSVTGTASLSNFGTYGQYSLGISGVLAGTGWLGFARVDFRDGPNLEGWSGTGGIRYQFTPEGSPKVMPIKTKAPPPVVTQAINWTGLYIGAFGGATQGMADWGYVGGEVSPHIGGYIFGGDIGYNYQIDRWVVGAEADLEKTNNNGGMACGPLTTTATPSITPGPMFQMTCNAWTHWMATAAARVGYTWDRVLFFVKGGGAWTDEHFSATCNFTSGFGCRNPAGLNSNGFTVSANRGGWVIGFGSEFALTRNWFAKAEADYISFGDQNVTASDGSPLRVGTHAWQEKIGVNYKF
jgi:outer membrane autotransporter protein